jgi:hypothetical protein
MLGKEYKEKANDLRLSRFIMALCHKVYQTILKSNVSGPSPPFDDYDQQ